MKDLLKFILENLLEFCPPLIILIFTVAFIKDDSCCLSSIIGKGCLLPITVVAFIAWIMWLFN